MALIRNNYTEEEVVEKFLMELQYQQFTKENIMYTLEQFNRLLMAQKSPYYIKTIHVDMSGLAEFQLYDTINNTIIPMSAAGFPSGMQEDFTTSIVYGYADVVESVDEPDKTIPEEIIPLEEAYGFISDQVEEMVSDWIVQNYDKHSIKEAGSYMYDIIQQKINDIAVKLVGDYAEENIEDCQEDEIEAMVESIVAQVSTENLYGMVYDVEHSADTFEDKLREIGMSIHDFI